MRKWFWLALLVLVVMAMVITSSGFFQPHPSSLETGFKPAPTSVESSNSNAAAIPQVTSPNVDAKQLIRHIKALNFKRYTKESRDRARNYLTQSLKKLGWSSTLQPFEGGVNIFAQRQGTDPEAGAVLVAAHYDTVPGSPGADDNASGVAVVLEVARLFGSRPTPRTLQLAFFDQEELGLRGSIAFAANEAHLSNLRGVIVMDMVGFACYTVGCQRYPAGLPIIPPTNRGDFLAVVGDSEHLPLLEAFHQSGQPDLPPVLTLPVPLKGMLIPDTLRSDHAPFWYHGVGAVLLTDTANLRTPHYHQPSDTPATLHLSFFTGAAQIVVNATTRLLESDDYLETQPSTLESEY
jgi:Zn-dependent M28 family amino/carboxypeptidase